MYDNEIKSVCRGVTCQKETPPTFDVCGPRPCASTVPGMVFYMPTRTSRGKKKTGKGKRDYAKAVVNGEDELVTTEGIYVTASLEAAKGWSSAGKRWCSEFQAGPARQRPASGRSVGAQAQLSSALRSRRWRVGRQPKATADAPPPVGAGCGSHPRNTVAVVSWSLAHAS
jgi:hypothetical protein